MKRNDMFFILLAIASGFLNGQAAKAEAAPPYTFTIVEVPGATHDTVAYGINNMDIIVGSYDDADGTHGFLYDGALYTSFDVPGSTETLPLNINDYGIVVGSYTDASGKVRGFSYDGSDYTSIDVPFPGVALTQAWGINNHNEIVGRYFDALGGQRGFWFDGTNYTPIQVPFPGVRKNNALGTNDHGAVVGSYTNASGGWGYMYDGTTYTTISYPGVTNTVLWDINDTGIMVGRYAFPDGRNHGFVYDGTEFVTLDLPFPTLINSGYTDINNAGKIVGVYADSSGRRGFLAEPIFANSPPEVTIDSVDYPNPSFVLPGDELTFTGSFTDLDPEDTHTATWAFGDGEIEGPTPAPDVTVATHSYANPGDYTVVLTVEDNNGGAGSADVTVEVITMDEGVTGVGEDIQIIIKAVEDEVPTQVTNDLEAAKQFLMGNDTGNSNNGALDKLESGDLDAALNKIKQAIGQLQNVHDAGGADTTQLQESLGWSAASVVRMAIETAEASPGADPALISDAWDSYDAGVALIESTPPDYWGAVSAFITSVGLANQALP
jgi:hypothetical protein